MSKSKILFLLFGLYCNNICALDLNNFFSLINENRLAIIGFTFWPIFYFWGKSHAREIKNTSDSTNKIFSQKDIEELSTNLEERINLSAAALNQCQKKNYTLETQNKTLLRENDDLKKQLELKVKFIKNIRRISSINDRLRHKLKILTTYLLEIFKSRYPNAYRVEIRNNEVGYKSKFYDKNTKSIMWSAWQKMKASDILCSPVSSNTLTQELQKNRDALIDLNNTMKENILQIDMHFNYSSGQTKTVLLRMFSHLFPHFICKTKFGDKSHNDVWVNLLKKNENDNSSDSDAD